MASSKFAAFLEHVAVAVVVASVGAIGVPATVVVVLVVAVTVALATIVVGIVGIGVGGATMVLLALESLLLELVGADMADIVGFSAHYAIWVFCPSAWDIGNKCVGTVGETNDYAPSTRHCGVGRSEVEVSSILMGVP